MTLAALVVVNSIQFVCHLSLFSPILLDQKNTYGWKTPPITPNLFPASPNPKRSTSLGSLPDADINYLNSQWPKLPYQEKPQQVCTFVLWCACVYVSNSTWCDILSSNSLKLTPLVIGWLARHYTDALTLREPLPFLRWKIYVPYFAVYWLMSVL